MTEQIAGFDVEHLHGPGSISYAEDELVVVCLVRDGRPWVETFVDHYFSLSAKHLVFMDNGSSDGTVEALRTYEDVTVLRSEAPFREHEDTMRRYMMERFCRGRWSLCVDIDELFDFPYSDIVGPRSFLAYLRSNAYTAVVAQMLDMFPETLALEPSNTLGRSLKEAHTFYDTSNLSRESVEGHHRCPPENTYANDETRVLMGGIRKTVFNVNTILTKHPLVFLDSGVKPISPGTHWAGGIRAADVTGVLYHYKFLGEYLHEVSARTVRGQQRRKNLGPYEKYLAALETNPNLRMRQETSREFSGVEDLLESGFLVASKNYLRWVGSEEEKALARTLPADESRDLVGSYLESRSRERAKTLRAGVLRQRLYEAEQEAARRARRAQNARKRSSGGHKKRKPEQVTWQPGSLKMLGVNPKTIVDVGVGRGTPQLYAAFPKAFQVLLEPLKEHEPGLEEILTRYEGRYFITAVGSAEGRANITVEPRSEHMSSMQERTALTATGDLAEKREVPVTTLDSLAREHNLEPPFGLKIDTEGFELEVVRGAPRFLQQTQFVIAEVSLAERFVGGYSFSEFTEAMANNGFFLRNIVNTHERYVDAVFLPSLVHLPTSLLLRYAKLRAKNVARSVGRMRRRH